MNFNKELFLELKPVKIKFVLTITFGLLAAVTTILLAFNLSKIISDVFLSNSSLENVYPIIYIFISLAVLKSLLVWIQNYFASKIVAYIKIEFRKRILKKIEEHGGINLKSERAGELVNTLLSGVDKLDDYLSKFLPQVFLSVFIPILVLIFVFPIDWLTALVFIITAPIIPIFMFLIGSMAEKLNKKQWQTLSRMSAYFFDVLQGAVTLKLFNRINDALIKIEVISNTFRIKTLRVLKIAFLSALVLEIAATISVAIVAVEIGLRLLSGNFIFSEALFILIIAPEFYLPLRMLGTSYHAGMEGISAFERVAEIFSYKNSNRYNNQTHLELSPLSVLRFNNVSFTYPDRRTKSLDQISLKIEPQKINAIVGKSGAGKSTIVNMLLGFLEPDGGNIFIDKTDFSEVAKENWRSNISWLPQTPYMYAKSILENIKIAKPDATFEEVVKATQNARIHNLINSLPNAYNTFVGENGIKLSGGEIQRIALARAYLRDTPLLIVDEPTANLDPIVEEEIIKDMYRLFSNKTVIVIAHRLNTIISADRIIVLDDGKILDIGHHTELLERSLFYRSLVNPSGELS
jgi:ATP-binding cassette subfamily C protein CydD